MIEVTVNTDLVAGTNRGGEDLYLEFTAKTPSKPDFELFKNQDNIKLILGEGSIKSLRLPDEEDEDEGDGENFLDAFEADKKIILAEGEYEFQWVGTKSQLVALAAQLLLDKKNWSRGIDSDECKFEARHFVHGNAD